MHSISSRSGLSQGLALSESSSNTLLTVIYLFCIFGVVHVLNWHMNSISTSVLARETSYSRVSPKTDIRERKYNSKSEDLQERVCYYIYYPGSSLGLV